MRTRFLFLLACLPLLVTSANPPATGTGNEVVIETFQNQVSFFDSWKIKKWDGTVQLEFLKDGAMPFVRLTCDDSSWAFLHKLDVDLSQTPMLTWSWRADAFPPGGDGRAEKTDDEVAQMYVFFPGTGVLAGVNKRLVGYTWETMPEAGTFYTSPRNENTKVFVLRNAKDGVGTWKQEARDVAADFRKAYGVPPPKPDVICFQIDSSDIHCKAQSCFADIRFKGRS